MFSIVKFLKATARLGLVRKVHYGHLGTGCSIDESCIYSNPQNLYIGNNVKIGGNSIIYSTNANVIIKDGFVCADGLKIASGDHERRVGRLCATITEAEKNHSLGLDKDVVINEDVWAGFNVVILAGVTVGRGCTIAAGSVVTKSTPPYSVVGGCPAKFIKFYWTVDQILEHERQLYPESERFSREYLEKLMAV